MKTRTQLLTDAATNLADNTTGDINPADVRNIITDLINSCTVRLSDSPPAGVRMTYTAATADADPGAGAFRLNNAALASVTAAFLDNTDLDGTDVSAMLDVWDDSTSTVRGFVEFRGVTNAGAWATYRMGGSVVDGTGYRKLSLVYVASGGSWVASDQFSVVFSRTGDAGATGAAGGTGPTGPAPVLTSTSASSVLLGLGSKSLTTAAALSLGVGAFVLIARTSAPTTTWMLGQISAITGTSVTVLVTQTVGSGTFTDWTVSLIGAPMGSAPAFVTLTDAATITWTLDPAIFEQSAKVLLGGNRTLAFSGLVDGMRGVLVVRQDGTGTRTLALPANSIVIGQGAGVVTLTTVASSVDEISWIYDGVKILWHYGLRFT